MDGHAIDSFMKQLTEVIKLQFETPDAVRTVDIKRDEMLTMDEVCARFRIHRNTLTGWLKAKKFPSPIVICGQKRWPSSVINNCIYEENPHLHERDHLIAEARRISA